MPERMPDWVQQGYRSWHPQASARHRSMMRSKAACTESGLAVASQEAQRSGKAAHVLTIWREISRSCQ